MRYTSKIYFHYLAYQKGTIEELLNLNQSPIEIKISSGVQRSEILSILDYMNGWGPLYYDRENIPKLKEDTLLICLNDSYPYFVIALEQDIQDCENLEVKKALECLYRKITSKVKES